MPVIEGFNSGVALPKRSDIGTGNWLFCPASTPRACGGLSHGTTRKGGGAQRALVSNGTARVYRELGGIVRAFLSLRCERLCYSIDLSRGAAVLYARHHQVVPRSVTSLKGYSAGTIISARRNINGIAAGGRALRSSLPIIGQRPAIQHHAYGRSCVPSGHSRPLSLESGKLTLKRSAGDMHMRPTTPRVRAGRPAEKWTSSGIACNFGIHD
ncbi:hypothetical protein BOTBODRAFT_142080 [Botryobasidium botryosum FD-172 SS1]|uniref:Uncharacterized protein n=1 Tax=Botryobasidium botryosum (strain FD-172 SS1) TaxID=930990 RepID=A0A067N8R0_BOTB1|nr:hypothetical protein BOTBODRAFT_142080 [Botryobasidium botryosum FD-172 SS1]